MIIIVYGRRNGRRWDADARRVWKIRTYFAKDKYEIIKTVISKVKYEAYPNIHDHKLTPEECMLTGFDPDHKGMCL